MCNRSCTPWRLSLSLFFHRFAHKRYCLRKPWSGSDLSIFASLGSINKSVQRRKKQTMRGEVHRIFFPQKKSFVFERAPIKVAGRQKICRGRSAGVASAFHFVSFDVADGRRTAEDVIANQRTRRSDVAAGSALD